MSKTFTSVHDQFDDTDSDIMIISSDRVAFKLHRKYLDSNTGVFPGPEVVDTKDQPIQLTEPASVLGIVFQFIYPRKHPKLNEEDFDTILAVAEAVEKYQVFSAMNTCETRLVKYLSSRDHAAEILGHAIKHDYPDIINAAVPHLARMRLIPLLEKLPSYSVLPWIRYQEAWKDVFGKALQHVNAKLLASSECSNSNLCIFCRASLIARISELERLETLSALTASLDNKEILYPNSKICTPCVKNTCIYQKEVIDICREGINALPPFTEFLSKLCV